MCSDFGALENKGCHCLYCFPIYLPWSDGTRCMIFIYWMLSFKPTFHSPLSLSVILGCIKWAVFGFSICLFPGGASGEEFICQFRKCKTCGFNLPMSGRSPRVGNGNPLQYSCLEHSMDRGAWQATVHRVTKSQTWPSTHTQPNWCEVVSHYGFDLHFPNIAHQAPLSMECSRQEYWSG